MIDTLKKMLGMNPPIDYDALVKAGAVVLDVRTKGEYKSGHIQGSVNIAVDELKQNLHRFPDKNQVIITCCASGMRSASAKRFLASSGYESVHNGGSWMALQQAL